METFKAKTIDEYIATFPVEVRPLLEEVREAILNAIPDAEEAISYDMPTFNLNGSYVIYFAGWKKHIALYPITETMSAKLKEELAGYKGTKNSVHFPLNKPMPVDLIAKIVEAKLIETPRRSKARR
ncbi:iron chaperone [Dyadobacter arcticus]|uniref:Uncharacterized protein YdhG (YjbR/CyaY superfamily) n=1 Tax=Dyadobacter arcticus TaxID=1078754 RepID=A0ABX0UIE3_9BACT|nr:DUF1801 domain-containing protein [Dyadobacter arcticus]NIJ52787.1 uncharacterized protein YdhG (YjbR/CyaY superfamily) [Dyadobacter arcticus]